MKHQAVTFDGLDDDEEEKPSPGKHKVQPPIKDPKTGDYYDLDDPEFPVVKDHTFKLRYWEMPRSTTFLLRYMKEHWEFFNKTRFHGRMESPKFSLLKDVDALRMKLRGRFSFTERDLALSPNLWNAPHEGWANRTLIHEMCHQYVYDVHGETEYKIKKGHGPLWKQTMVMAGLPPSQFDNTSNEMYFDAKEIKKHKPLLDYRATFRELKATHRKVPAPSKFVPVIFSGVGGVVVVGVIACKILKKGNWWAVSSFQDGKFMWNTVHEDNLFVPFDHEAEGINISALMNAADRLHSEYVRQGKALP